MTEIGKKNFSDLLKGNIAVITAALSLIALTLSVVQSFTAHYGTAAVVSLIAGTILLVGYNVWITTAAHPSAIDPGAKMKQFSRRFRVTVYAVSVVFLLIAWTITGITTSHKYIGYVMFSLGKYDLAAEHLKLTVQGSADDYQTLYKLAICHKKTGNLKLYFDKMDSLLLNDAAFAEFDDDEKLQKEIEIRFNSALDLISYDYIEGIPDPNRRALVHVEKARLLQRTEPVWILMLGYIRAAEAGENAVGNPYMQQRITSIFDDALILAEEAYPEQDKYIKFLSLYHLWYGRSLYKFELYDRSKEHLEKGLEILETEGTGQPGLKDSYLMRLGQNELFRTKNLEAAYEYWQHISDDFYLAEALTLAGYSYWSEGWQADNEGDFERAEEKFDAAEVALSEAASIGRETFKLYLILGVLYFNREEYVHAVANFSDAARIDPVDPLGYYWIGRSHFMLNNLDQARDAMSHSLELNPGATDTHYWLGRILYDLGDRTSACAEFEKSIASDRSNTKSYMYMVSATYDLANEKEEYGAERIGLMEKALRYSNDGMEVAQRQGEQVKFAGLRNVYCIISNSLAYCYVQRGENLALALNYIDEALQLESENPYYIDTKAWILVKIAELSETFTDTQKQGYYNSAEGLFNQAVNSYGQTDKDARAETLYHLGYIEMLRGDRSAARSLFLQAIALNPQYEEAKTALDKLR